MVKGAGHLRQEISNSNLKPWLALLRAGSRESGAPAIRSDRWAPKVCKRILTVCKTTPFWLFLEVPGHCFAYFLGVQVGGPGTYYTKSAHQTHVLMV